MGPAQGKAASGWDAHAGGVLGIDVHRSGRIASAGRDRRINVWEAAGALVVDLGPTADQATRVTWTPDGHTLASGDSSGELRNWGLDGSSSTLLSDPAAPKPPALALIVPDMTPARPLTPRPSATPTVTGRRTDSSATGDDIDVALASARAAAAAAQKTVADLSRIARARSAVKEDMGRQDSARSAVLEAIDSASAGLTSLRAALEADPTNTSLSLAVEETRRALHLLEQKRDHSPAGRFRP